MADEVKERHVCDSHCAHYCPAPAQPVSAEADSGLQKDIEDALDTLEDVDGVLKLQNELDNMHQQNVELREELANERANIEALVAENTRLLEQVATRGEVIQKLESEAEAAEAELAKAREELERAKKDLADSRVNHIDANQRNMRAIARAEAAESMYQEQMRLKDEYKGFLRAAEAELERWKTWGVVEVAVRNPQVADYCKHWEGRVEAAEKDAASWKSHWRMYRDAWVRELGGWIFPKTHEIDSLVLTTRKRCVNPLVGNCGIPHWLGEPTEDGKAFQQTPHPRDNDCRDWKADDSEPNPRAEAAEAKLAKVRNMLAALQDGE